MRIPSLDGLRAISILLVIFWHLSGTPGIPVHLEYDFGRLGVRVFFVISGFLITHLLMAEKAKTGSVSLSAFYKRRTLRIFPAFYAFILAALILERFGVITLQPHDALSAATYTMNYHHVHAPVFGHLWSLSVEEQFYLVWPTVFVFTERPQLVALGAVLLAPVIRVVCYRYPAIGGAGLGESFPTIMDAIATGCCLALYREKLQERLRYRTLVESSGFFAPALAVAAMALPQKMQIVFGETIANVCIAIMIDRLVRQPPRFLNTRPIVFLGTLSYSLYLWQQLFLCREPVVRFGWWNVPLAFAAALAGYYLIERPVQRWRKK